MKNLYFLDGEEKDRILNLHESATKRQYLSEQGVNLTDPLGMNSPMKDVIVQGPAGDPYQYMKWSDKFWYAKKSEGKTPNWIEVKTPKGVESIKNKIYSGSPLSTKPSVSPIKKTTKPSGLNNFKLKPELNPTAIDSTKVGNGREVIIPKLKDKEITKKIKDKTPNTQPGASSWLRKRFPNIAELLKGRELTPNDFTDGQKKALLSAINNSQKRTKNQNMGNTDYPDYGNDVASTFQNEKGSPSNWDVIWNSVTNNDRFAMATLFGKFNWVKNSDGSYTIEDKYDFKNPNYENIAGVNRKNLEGKTITQLQSDYDLGAYEAARVKGWVDHPEEIPGKAIPLKLQINPSDLT